tara:strand:- start:248 stop:1111 length:864 start_codon:yes stop_codon:yes gene_type:complete
MTIQVNTQSIGPDQAKTLLATNIKNRDLSQSFVNKYAADMANGKWSKSASMIRIDTEGNLQDGQHRLEAILQSGTTQEFVVAENCPTEDFKVLDIGRGRSSRDALTILGYKRPRIMASAIRLVCLWNAGIITKTAVDTVSTENNLSHSTSNRLSKGESINQAIEYAKLHPMVNPLIERAVAIQKSNRLIPSSVYGAFLFKANEIGHETLEFATEFLKEFAECSGKPGTATHSLFMKIVQQSKGGLYYTQVNRLALFVVAWNAWIKGQPRINIVAKNGIPKMEKASDV